MSKTTRAITITLVLVAIVGIAFGAGTVVGSQRSPGLSVIEQAWNIILHDYVETGRIDPDKLAQGAVKGMVTTLDDPYTVFFDASAYELSVRNLEGTLEGIGAYVGERDNQVTIISPIAGSPADKAGMKAGDTILKVNGKSIEGMSLIEVVLLIQGPRGTAVTLSILHTGEAEPVSLEIVRAQIDVPSVSTEMKGDIVYIRINQFAERTAQELAPIIAGIPISAVGIMLDLRGNPGGLLDTVVDICGLFLEPGKIMVEVVDNQGKRRPSYVSSSRTATKLPMVVLIDKGSASGSEVLTGALQDYGRATVAGQTSYGKGSVNILRRLSDGSGMYITTARWLTPNGRLIEGKGLQPDYPLATDQDAVQWAIDFLHAG
jgi:carboxyl-terminal processing protease